MSNTVVGVFDRFLLAEDAIQELARQGFHRDRISIVAGAESAGGVNQEAARRRAAGETAEVLAGTGAGAAVGGVAGLVVGLAAMALPGGAPAAAGPLEVSMGLGAGAAAGGLLGAFAESHIPENDANYYTDTIRRGGAVVVVKASDEEAGRAREILDAAGANKSNPDSRKPQPLATPALEETPELEEERELERSSRPEAPQIVLSGSRIYQDGLEMNPRKSTFEDFEQSWRQDFESHFAGSGYSYRQLAPAYRFGHELAANELYRGKNWSAVEPSAYRDWEESNPNTWEQVKDAVRYGFSEKRH